MVVLSLFDGISCGMLALSRAGINVKRYFASEVCKDAIKVSGSNHKNITQIGDVTKVYFKDGDLITENGTYQVGKIDLLIGGSPCQSFSTAAAISGNQVGLDGRSKLFYEYLRILESVQDHNKDVKFLLENVKMKKKDKDSLDEFLGVTGVGFNSELVSYQKRSRIYWTNWDWDMPNCRGINFQDYKENGNDLDAYKLNKTPSRVKMWGGGLSVGSALGICANITKSEKIYWLTTKQDRCPNSGLIEYDGFARYLTRGEMEQAQNLPVGYTNCISYNKAQKAIGNGWTVDAVAHIFSYLR